MLNDILDDQLDFNNSNFNEETITKINLLKIDANEYVKQIKSGRTTLYVLCGITVLGAIIGATAGNDYDVSDSEVLIEGAILLVIYGICAVFIKKNPSVALLIALIVYILIILLSAIIDPESLISGILMKGLILFYIGRGVNAAFLLKKVIQKLRKLGISDKELNQLKDLDFLLKTKRTPRTNDIL